MLRCLPPCKGNHTPAQGDALGNRRKLYELQALKGRHNRSTRRCRDSSSRTSSVSCARDVSPLQGSDVMVGFSASRALPWADLFRPLRGHIQNSATPKRVCDGPNPSRSPRTEPDGLAADRTQHAGDRTNPTRRRRSKPNARNGPNPTGSRSTEPNGLATDRTQHAGDRPNPTRSTVQIQREQGSEPDGLATHRTRHARRGPNPTGSRRAAEAGSDALHRTVYGIFERGEPGALQTRC